MVRGRKEDLHHYGKVSWSELRRDSSKTAKEIGLSGEELLDESSWKIQTEKAVSAWNGWGEGLLKEEGA